MKSSFFRSSADILNKIKYSSDTAIFDNYEWQRIWYCQQEERKKYGQSGSNYW